jgi:hypothetical protein
MLTHTCNSLTLETEAELQVQGQPDRFSLKKKNFFKEKVCTSYLISINLHDLAQITTLTSLNHSLPCIFRSFHVNKQTVPLPGKLPLLPFSLPIP